MFLQCLECFSTSPETAEAGAIWNCGGWPDLFTHGSSLTVSSWTLHEQPHGEHSLFLCTSLEPFVGESGNLAAVAIA